MPISITMNSAEEEEVWCECSDDETYNPCKLKKGTWEPTAEDMLKVFEELKTKKVLELKWKCPGRRPPESDNPKEPEVREEVIEKPQKQEEKKPVSPSEFDFDGFSEAKPKLTPRRTPGSAPKSQRMARMDKVLKEVMHQRKLQQAEREAKRLAKSPRTPGSPSRARLGSPAGSPRTPPAATGSSNRQSPVIGMPPSDSLPSTPLRGPVQPESSIRNSILDSLSAAAEGTNTNISNMREPVPPATALPGLSKSPVPAGLAAAHPGGAPKSPIQAGLVPGHSAAVLKSTFQAAGQSSSATMHPKSPVQAGLAASRSPALAKSPIPAAPLSVHSLSSGSNQMIAQPGIGHLTGKIPQPVAQASRIQSSTAMKASFPAQAISGASAAMSKSLGVTPPTTMPTMIVTKPPVMAPTASVQSTALPRSVGHAPSPVHSTAIAFSSVSVPPATIPPATTARTPLQTPAMTGPPTSFPKSHVPISTSTVQSAVVTASPSPVPSVTFHSSTVAKSSVSSLPAPGPSVTAIISTASTLYSTPTTTNSTGIDTKDTSVKEAKAPATPVVSTVPTTFVPVSVKVEPSSESSSTTVTAPMLVQVKSEPEQENMDTS